MLFLVWTGVLAGRPCVVRWVKLVHQVIRKREADMFLKAIASLFESALTVLTTSPSALGAAFDPNIAIAGALHDPDGSPVAIVNRGGTYQCKL